MDQPRRRHTSMYGQRMFFRWCRKALRGDQAASRFLVKLSVIELEAGRPLSQGQGRFLARLIKSPDNYAKLMIETEKRKTRKRGRPFDSENLDRRREYLRSVIPNVSGKIFKPFFGSDVTERSALMVAYLHSQGHPMNVVGTADKESAVVLVAEVTGRSTRQLQRDYAKHKAAISQSGDSLERGRVIYESRKTLANISASHRHK